MSELAQRRVRDFQQRCGETALHLAYHAALPVALNADLLHFLRINFFLDPPEPLPYTIEFEFLLSPLCREIDEGLYEVEPDIRNILLAGLAQEYDEQRIRDVSTLLWKYVERFSAWSGRSELERAQQLTALNFLNPEKAQQWLSTVVFDLDCESNEQQEWFIAIQQEIENQAQEREPQTDLINPINSSPNIEIAESAIEAFLDQGYELEFQQDFGLNEKLLERLAPLPEQGALTDLRQDQGSNSASINQLGLMNSPLMEVPDSYCVRVSKEGEIVLDSSLSRTMGLKPGDEFEIKLDYKNLHLIRIDEQDNISNKRRELDSFVQNVLSERRKNIDPILPFIQRRLQQYSIGHIYEPSEVFLEAYKRAFQEIDSGGDISSISAWFRYTSLRIIQEYSRNEMKLRQIISEIEHTHDLQ